jgi:hypothetical protein
VTPQESLRRQAGNDAARGLSGVFAVAMHDEMGCRGGS